MQRVSATDIAEEMAFDELEPMPNFWLGVGLICSTVANMMSTGKGKSFKPQDFMPIKPQSEAREMFEQFKSAAVRSSAVNRSKRARR